MEAVKRKGDLALTSAARHTSVGTASGLDRGRARVVHPAAEQSNGEATATGSSADEISL